MKKNIGLIFSASVLVLILSTGTALAAYGEKTYAQFNQTAQCEPLNDERCNGLKREVCTAELGWQPIETCTRDCIQYNVDGERGTTCRTTYLDYNKNTGIIGIALVVLLFAIYSITKQKRK